MDKLNDQDDLLQLNYQFLRATKQKIFSIERRIIITKAIINGIKDINQESIREGILTYALNLKRKLLNEIFQRDKYLQIYNRITTGIEKKSPYISIEKTSIANIDYMFSSAYSMTTQTDDDLLFFYFLKLNFESESFFYIGVPNNKYKKDITSNFDLTKPSGRRLVAAMMMDEKENFVFSSEFKNKLDAHAKNIFTINKELYNKNYTKQELLVIANHLFL